MLLAYNTNGLAHHDLLEAIELLAEVGYRGISITLDHGALNPFDKMLPAQLDKVSAALATHDLRCVIETGARYLLDSRNKHEPTFVNAEVEKRDQRVDFICRAIDIAARLNADCVSLWSGVVRDGATDKEAFGRLLGSLSKVIQHADRQKVMLAFEPEPGMFINTLVRYEELLSRLAERHIATDRLGLTIDVGHLHCQGETPVADQICRWDQRIANIHIEDMRAGIHEHLMFGEGEIDFPPVIAALARIGYAGLVGVELSRHSHAGPEAARQAYEFLQPLLRAAEA